MLIRTLAASDLDRVRDIDGTIESTDYFHLECSGEPLTLTWTLDRRPLREKLIQSNPIADEAAFIAKEIALGAEEGLALLAEHEDLPAALLVARAEPQLGTMRIEDLRVDYDYRRQGIGTALIFRAIQEARERGLRAVAVEVRTNNHPAIQLLSKCGFTLGGIDTHRHSNHDLVKEVASLFWYAALD